MKPPLIVRGGIAIIKSDSPDHLFAIRARVWQCEKTAKIGPKTEVPELQNVQISNPDGTLSCLTPSHVNDR